MKQQKEAGLEVKGKYGCKKGMNDSQILPMARYFKEQEIQLRFIEFMDVGSTNGWNFEQVITEGTINRKINRVYPIEPVTPRYFGEVEIVSICEAMQKLDLLLQYLSHFVLLVRELVFRQTVSFYVSIWNERNRLTNAS